MKNPFVCVSAKGHVIPRFRPGKPHLFTERDALRFAELCKDGPGGPYTVRRATHDELVNGVNL